MSLDWGKLIFTLAGGLAIFLYGMLVMIDALKAVAGNKLKAVLTGMTSNRWNSLFAGIGITAVTQSSSVTTVLVVGLVSAGLLAFPRTLGIILGADIGTTITTQIIAFKITEASLFLIFLGFLFKIVYHRKSYREYGTVLLGLGLVFLGMNIMGQGVEPLKQHGAFISMMKNLENPIWGILLAALFTALIQSSAATIGLVIVLSMQGLLTINAGISLIIGANIGTCITAALAAIGRPRPAIQVAVAHVSFKVIGALLWFFFIPELGKLVEKITPADLPRQIANAHTIFNTVNALLFIGLTGLMARLVTFIVPDTKKGGDVIGPVLDDYYLEHTGMALDVVQNAIKELGKFALEVAKKGIFAALDGTATDLSILRDQDRKIDDTHKKILIYLHQIQQKELNANETIMIRNQIEASNILETLGDLITTDLVEATEHRIEMEFQVSAETYKLLSDLYSESVDAMQDAVESFITLDREKGLHVINSKVEYKEKLYLAREHLAERLSVRDANRIMIIRFETEIIEVTRRMHALARRLARIAKEFEK